MHINRCKFAAARLSTIVLLVSIIANAQLFHKPSKETRGVNTVNYEFALQKNGRLDINLPSRLPVFENAYPAVILTGDKTPKYLKINGMLTQTEPLKTVLGEGNELIVGGDGAIWRLHSYPVQPFFAVQLEYENRSKQAVQVAALLPWSVGDLKKGSLRLGAEASEARILVHGKGYDFSNTAAAVKTGQGVSNWNAGVYNPSAGRALIMGSLSNSKARTELRIARSEDAEGDAFDSVQVLCIYDPPVTLQPGESLASEIIYISVAERNPVTALRRYGHALASWNRKSAASALPRHGWNVARHNGDPSETSFLAELETLDAKLARYGWTHLGIGPGWETSKGDWQPDRDKFPNGFRGLIDAAHTRGLTAGLALNPWLVDKESALAATHPDWLVAPDDTSGRHILGDDVLILDPTVPEAHVWVQSLARRVTQEWGFDTFSDADTAHPLLFASAFQDKSKTRLEVLHQGLAALRAGSEGNYLNTAPPGPVTGIQAHAVRLAGDTLPSWKAPIDAPSWGAVDVLTNAARHFYLAPLFNLDLGPVFLAASQDSETANSLSPGQSLAWLTGAALTGGVAQIGKPYGELSDDEIETLRRLLPSAGKAANPLDVLDPNPPRVWHLPLERKMGAIVERWDILGLFNWSEAEPQTMSVPLSALGLSAEAFCTVYDFWPQKYLGTIQGQLEVAAPAGAVRLLGLRRLEGHPILIASDSHYTQGYIDHEALHWDAGRNTLTGKMQGIERTAYALTVAVPEPYVIETASCSAGETIWEAAEAAARIKFTATASGPVHWEVRFRRIQ